MKRSTRAALSGSLFLLLAPLGSAASPGAGTDVFGGLVSGQTWTMAGSPYRIHGDVQLAGVDIQEGVEVLVDPGFQIEVLTQVSMVGSAAMPVVLTAADKTDASTYWRGLEFTNVPTSPASELRHVVVEYASSSGIRIFDSSPVIEDCSVRDCTTATGGGGILVNNATLDLQLLRCRVYDNTAVLDGGGIQATMGSGTLRLVDSAVCRNTANPDDNQRGTTGGGLRVVGSSELISSMICGNSARAGVYGSFVDLTTSGGGLILVGDATIENCYVGHNECRTTYYGGSFTTRRARGGGLYLSSGTVSLENLVVGGNQNAAGSERSGAGIYQSSGTTSVLNATVARNGTESGFSTGIHVTSGTLAARNSILYFNNGPSPTPPAYGPQTNDFAGITLDYCDVQGGPCPGCAGANNFDFQPVFRGVLARFQDLRISPFSQLVDAGDPDMAYDDGCFALNDPTVPGYGTSRNDVGAHGGPKNCAWDMDESGVAWPDLGVAAARLVHRNAAPNPDVYSSEDLPVIGQLWTGMFVKQPTEACGILFFLGGPRQPFLTSFGALLGQGPILDIEASLDPEIPILVPNDPKFVGFLLTTQGFLGTSLADLRLTNALDLCVGSF